VILTFTSGNEELSGKFEDFIFILLTNIAVFIKISFLTNWAVIVYFFPSPLSFAHCWMTLSELKYVSYFLIMDTKKLLT